jgi:hypothetical protein
VAAVHGPVPLAVAAAAVSHGAWRGRFECPRGAQIRAFGSRQPSTDPWCLAGGGC